jgi:hypothetical protein
VANQPSGPALNAPAPHAVPVAWPCLSRQTTEPKAFPGRKTNLRRCPDLSAGLSVDSRRCAKRRQAARPAFLHANR